MRCSCLQDRGARAITKGPLSPAPCLRTVSVLGSRSRPKDNAMPAIIRKTVKFTETTFIEGGRPADTPVLMVAAAAVIANPWAGKGFVEDLRPVILEAAPGLADVLVPMLLDELGGAPTLEAYGKAAVV